MQRFHIPAVQEKVVRELPRGSRERTLNAGTSRRSATVGV